MGMGAGIHVGRVGALAVALGIGAAVATGQGVASATPTDSSGSETTKATPSDTASTTTSTDTTENTDPSTADKPTDTDAAGPDAGTDKADAADPPKRKKRSRAAESSTDVSKPKVDTTESTQTDEPRARTLRDDRDDNDTSPVNDESTPPPTAAVAMSTATVERTVSQETASTAEQQKPEDALTVGISSFISAIVSPFAGNGTDPTAPVDNPAVWTLAAASRRDFLGSVPALDKAAAETTNGLAATNAATLAEDTEDPQPVVAIPSTPVLTQFGVQNLPIIGPLLVAPVIAIVHQVPLVGDILHPFIGYPIGFTGGTTPRDVKVISFDGNPIYVHFFPAQNLPAGTTRAPTILNGPGLGLPGETNPLALDNPFLQNQVVGMGTLLQNGYNVVTWDPRGEWGSKAGVLEIDHPEFEARDMQAIISWVAQQPEAAFDPGSTTDPLIGMVGVSYGGGIQLVTAAVDKRVDAIVPTIAWNNLNTSLDKNGAPKTSWGLLLSAALLLTGANTDPLIFPALLNALFSGAVAPSDQDFLAERGPDYLLDQIEAPTLLVEGTVDTLFTLAEAHENALALIENGVPTKVVWYCGGHGGCITSVSDGDVVDRATMSWLDKYVKGLPVSTGPQFEWIDQHGRNFSSDVYPVPSGSPLEAESDESNTLPLNLFFGGSGPNLRAFEGGPIQGFLGLLSGAEATNAVELTIDPQETTTYIVGAPELTFTYSGTGTSTHVYAQLVDDATGLVLGNHVTPIPVTLDGAEHEASFPLEMVAHTLAPGQTVTLQIVASAVTYQPLNVGGSVTISNITLTLPTADPSQITLPVDMDSAA
jgi:ABC-2 type transport system ATP-binding protein